ncbi:MAG: c-type cytochrome [Pseudomonadota bacterium]
MRASRSVVGIAALWMLACSREPEAPPTPVWERVQADATLEEGRKVFVGTCRRCHAYGLEGAPRVGDADAWKARIAGRPEEALIRSALTGVQGKAGGEMPARGGNEQLSDREVALAVRFMLAASR